jgi:hypothetical protein
MSMEDDFEPEPPVTIRDVAALPFFLLAALMGSLDEALSAIGEAIAGERQP